MIGKKGLAIGIIGGIGLGFLLGSEYPSSYTTLSGAGLIVISIIALIIFSIKDKKD